MKTLLLILVTFLPLKSNNSCLQLDIVLIGDISGSVQGFEPFIRKAFLSFSNKFELDEDGVNIGVMVFNDIPYVLCPVTADKSKFNIAITNVPAASGSTNMLRAFYVAMEELLQNGRPGYKKIIIVVSDGMPDDKYEVMVAAKQMQAVGIDVYGLLITNAMYDESFMESISVQYFASKYEDLADKIKKLDICL